MEHPTKNLGDTAAMKVAADLTEKGYDIFIPYCCEHLRFDMIAHKEGKMYKIQAKHSSHGSISKGTSWNDKNGNHKRFYVEGDFDYYGIYLPDKKVCVYPSITYAGRSIKTELPITVNDSGYLWWEDFLEFTDNAKPRFEYDVKRHIEMSLERSARQKGIDRLEARKVIWPTKEELEKLVWEKPTSQLAIELGISDVAIRKWCNKYKINKPGVGYWAKKYSADKKNS